MPVPIVDVRERDPRLRDICIFSPFYPFRRSCLRDDYAPKSRIAMLRSCNALCAGDETIKEQREGCISVFGGASRADAARRQSRVSPPPFVVAMPDFRNALERSARTTKGRSGNSLAAVGIL